MSSHDSQSRDQARHLRQIVALSARTAWTARAASGARRAVEAPNVIVLASGKGGVGVTTLAVNLAVTLALEGRRTVLIDADLQGAAATNLCRLDATSGVAELLSGEKGIHEVLVPGPAGVQVVPGAWAPATPAAWSPPAPERLLRSCQELGPHAEVVVVDGGSAPLAIVRRLWRAARRAAIVTSPDVAAVMGTYAAIKSAHWAGDPLALDCIVNLAADENQAREAHFKLARACRRFLGLDLPWAGFTRNDPRVAQAAAGPLPAVMACPQGDLARLTSVLAQKLLAEGSQRAAAG
jgi:flagellar biosynthesis protein FlhG